MVAILLYSFTSVDKEAHTEIVDTLEDLPEPIQIKTTGEKNTIINGVETHLTYAAEYTIVGRVVTTHDYKYNSVYQSVLPRDVGIAWGWLSNREVDSKISWHTKHRYAGFYVADDAWLHSKGGVNAIFHYASNNHLIPSDDTTTKLIKSIRKGDYVKIEGYLVSVKWDRFSMGTSTSRTDRGDGACETIYVTKVTWLKTR